MAHRVVGLDIGTHAVRAVELSFGRGRPVIQRMGQVALPPGAVVAGEVIDPTSVGTALRRLWREVQFSTRSVVVGVANQRVVARTAELPDLPDAEMRSSLPYQVQDLIPIPLDEAELDFQVVERVAAPDGSTLAKLLIVAAHREMLHALLEALAGADLQASRVDLVPFALIRALHDPGVWLEDDPAEGAGSHELIVAVGSGITNVVVHEHGIPQFVRTLPFGGDAVSDSLIGALGVDRTRAEAIKRAIPGAVSAQDLPEVTRLTSAAVEPLVGEVAGSLDFHLGQLGRSALRRVVVTGGGARLPALRQRMAENLGVAVVSGTALDHVDVGKVGLAPEAVASSAELFVVATGLALSGLPLESDARRISLLPSAGSAVAARRRRMALTGGLAAAAVVLGGMTYLRADELSAVRAEAAQAEAARAALDAKLATLADVAAVEDAIGARRQTVAAAVAGEVDWTPLVRHVAASLPRDVWLTSLSGTRPSQGEPGRIEVIAKGGSHSSGARLLQALDGLPGVEEPWLTNGVREASSGPSVVTYNVVARLTPEAESRRSVELKEVQP